MTDDIKAIRDALAAGPTPGPWHYRRGDEWSHSVVTHHGNLPDGSINCWTVADVNKRREPEHTANGALIAACHPERIARLLDALQAAERNAARYSFLLNDCRVAFLVLGTDPEKSALAQNGALSAYVDAAMTKEPT